MFQAHQATVSSMLGVPPGNTYIVPQYQREYNWRRDNWESLFEDLEENDPGYFLGSIICINGFGGPLEPKYHIVDGQQRLITLSLFIAALYNWLDARTDQLDKFQQADLIGLQRNLLLNSKPRVVPQVQNSNREDYIYILGRAGAGQRQTAPRWVPIRRIYKAYEFFLARVDAYSKMGDDPIERVFQLHTKLVHATFVMIEVPSATNAHVLFASLNNRGVPLSAVDLIKNELLSVIEKHNSARVDSYYKKWDAIVGNLGPDTALQERFLRHFFNASRNAFTVSGYSFATRSNLIKIYEKLIEAYQGALVDGLEDASVHYAKFSANAEVDYEDNLQRALRNLSLIQGASSYTLMLHLLIEKEKLGLDDTMLKLIVETLTAFFVRRNLTGRPGTNRLDRLFIEIVDSIGDCRGNEVPLLIQEKLRKESESEEDFISALNGPIYEDNEAVARFILCHLAERHMVIGSFQDLWLRKGGSFVWTIEHVLPQGDNLRDDWIQKIAEGDRVRAQDVQRRQVHTIGNLTLTGYNPQLSNLGFIEKRDRTNAKGDPIGYKNGLWLNSDLKEAETWNEASIKRRGQRIIDEAIKVYRL